MDIHDFALTKRYDLRHVVDLSSDVNPLGPSNKAKHAIRKVIKYLSFPPDDNLIKLKRYIAKKEKIDEGQLIFSNGLPTLLHIAVMVYKPKTILVFPPLPEAYRRMLTRYRNISPPVEIKENGGGHNMESILRGIGDCDMLLLSNPHRFTGAFVREEDLAVAVEEAHKNGKMIFLDESCMDFTDLSSPVDAVIRSENGLIVRTFSTFYGLSGLPVAYGIGSLRVIEKLKAFFFPEQISLLAYMAVLASLKDKGYRKRTLLFINGEKKFIRERLKDVESIEVIDTPCNFLLIKLKKTIADLEERFLERRIIVEIYRGEKDTIFKFPVKSHKHNAAVIKTLKAILRSSYS